MQASKTVLMVSKQRKASFPNGPIFFFFFFFNQGGWVTLVNSLFAREVRMDSPFLDCVHGTLVFAKNNYPHVEDVFANRHQGSFLICDPRGITTEDLGKW